MTIFELFLFNNPFCIVKSFLKPSSFDEALNLELCMFLRSFTTNGKDIVEVVNSCRKILLFEWSLNHSVIVQELIKFLLVTLMRLFFRLHFQQDLEGFIGSLKMRLMAKFLILLQNLQRRDSNQSCAYMPSRIKDWKKELLYNPPMHFCNLSGSYEQLLYWYKEPHLDGSLKWQTY